MANATGVAKNNETGQEFRVPTTTAGAFSVPALGTGLYSVTITAQGFKQTRVEAVKVDVGKTSDIRCRRLNCSAKENNARRLYVQEIDSV